MPDLQFSKPKKILGNSTIESIRSEVFFGVFDEIKSRIEFHKKLTPKLNVILTGGDALHFKKTIKNVIFDDNLLMKGLNLLLDYNVKKYVMASTASIYAGSKMPYREDSSVNQPISP